jgi:DNA-binding transcriptional ArsR family regulator
MRVDLISLAAGPPGFPGLSPAGADAECEGSAMVPNPLWKHAARVATHGQMWYLQPSGSSTIRWIMAAVDELSRTFAALADPTRREILARLAEGEATVKELAEPFPVTVQAISKHLKVLEEAGLISRGRTAQLRPSRLVSEPLKNVDDWVEPYRRFWEASFDRLEARLRSSEEPDGC